MAAVKLDVRNHLTTLLWHEDRLSSLSAKYLVPLGILFAAGAGGLLVDLLQFLDDLAFLLSENDRLTALVFFELLLVLSAALWVLSCCLGALARRIVLHFRGL